MSCASPLAWETLVDWWAGDLDEAAAAAVEEHVLGCDVCTVVASRVASTAEALRTMVPPVVGAEQLEALARAGVRIMENPIAPGQTCDFHFPRNADLAVHVLGGLVLGAGARVEVTLRSLATGQVFGHVEDAPVDTRRRSTRSSTTSDGTGAPASRCVRKFPRFLDTLCQPPPRCL
jgi:hypothetical protein